MGAVGNSGGAAPCPKSEPDVSSCIYGLFFATDGEDFCQTVFSPCLLSGKQFLIFFHVETARLLVGESVCFKTDESPKVQWRIRILSPRLSVHEANGTFDLHDIDRAFSRCAHRTRM